jgi:hypothetical protein
MKNIVKSTLLIIVLSVGLYLSDSAGTQFGYGLRDVEFSNQMQDMFGVECVPTGGLLGENVIDMFSFRLGQYLGHKYYSWLPVKEHIVIDKLPIDNILHIEEFCRSLNKGVTY